jgi:phosphopantothenoylcysteine decarboxylase/phosphopantothenate--cysteine ligase
MLKGKKILVAVSGSIAAYKIPVLVRLLVKEGAEVKVIMTPAAMEFVSRLTLATLSKNAVPVALFDEETWANHVMLGRWADLMLVAPLSCNTLAKMAGGHCDNLVLATYLSATCPVMVAPAMDEDMWHHPSTTANLATLRAHGCITLDVVHGELASGLIGEGRMAEPETILQQIARFFLPGRLKGKKALVTAGPTYEAIDPVRFIGNHSSGKMGFALAEALGREGASVTLVTGPVSIRQAAPGIDLYRVQSAAEMHALCIERSDYDIAIMAAAVADYTPERVSGQKIKKGENGLMLQLKRTEDILASLGKMKTKGQFLVGFALETENEEENAIKKLQGKNADMIVLNSLNDQGAGFGHDTNRVTVFLRDGAPRKLDLKRKEELAGEIVDLISNSIQ